MDASSQTLKRFSGSLEWKNALYELPPEHNEVVLASVDGVYLVVVYDAERNVFKPQHLVGMYYSPKEYSIYWANFRGPSTVLSIVPKK
jgi:hypothetical protein